MKFNLTLCCGELGSKVRRAERAASSRETSAGISSRTRIQHAHRGQMASGILHERVHANVQGIRLAPRLLERSP